jgi:peptide/nickel transport system substrate-binding protein
MKMNKLLARVFALLLVVALALSACSKDEPAATDPTPTPGATQSPGTTTPGTPTDPTVTPRPMPAVERPSDRTRAADPNMPMVFSAENPNGVFSPFFYSTQYDADIWGPTQVSTMTLDRVGGIVMNAIEGEWRDYNGVSYFYQGIADLSSSYNAATNISTYRMELRTDIKFSDGTPMTADDLMFSIYVGLDNDYDGLGSFDMYDVVGLRAYKTQVPEDALEKYVPLMEAIYAAGPDHTWSASDGWTQDLQNKFWSGLDAVWATLTRQIVDYCASVYLDAYAEAYTGYAPDAIRGNAGMETMLGMVLWGFGDVDGGVLTGAVTGTEWNLDAGEYPTVEDYVLEIKEAYDYDFVSAWDVEDANGISGEASLNSYSNGLIAELAAAEGAGSGVKQVRGINKIDNYTVEIQSYGLDPAAGYGLLWFTVVPLHYYGDKSQYDPDNGKFGFPFGDLTIVRSKTTQPMGAGPYIFLRYENDTAYYEANPYYWMGEPLTKNLQLKVTPRAETIIGIVNGAVDADMNFLYNNERRDEIMGYNSNGEISGNVINAQGYLEDYYGYAGIYAPNILVGNDRASEASKNLRKALATIISVCRDTAVNRWGGERGFLLNYPISPGKWAMPQATDEGYKVAYSTDVNGNPIYTASMSSAQRYEAAKQAALGFFAAAGYTVENGKVVSGPGGPDATRSTYGLGERPYLEFNFSVPGEGSGDHYSLAMGTHAKELFADIGITLNVMDVLFATQIERKNAGQLEIYCMAWGSGSPDPGSGLWQTYHSTSRATGTTPYNDYGIESTVVDSLLDQGKNSLDEAYRKIIYRQLLEEVMDWGVEVPVFARYSYYLFSAERVNLDSLEPGISSFVGPTYRIENLEMR